MIKKGILIGVLIVFLTVSICFGVMLYIDFMPDEYGPQFQSEWISDDNRIVFVINNKKQLYGRGVYTGIYDCGGEQKSIRVVIDSHYAYADINDYDHKSVFSGNTWINPLTNSLSVHVDRTQSEESVYIQGESIVFRIKGK
ncbi:MAG: hypothetical protein IJ598_06265 [Ruminococcus sp.]|nr:hypothetical protein [Ruminococcus sp.]